MAPPLNDALVTIALAGGLLVAALGAALQLPWALEDLAATRRTFVLAGRWLARRPLRRPAAEAERWPPTPASLAA